jgi:glycosyltransferase involved in cell wall biosynthesis
MHISPVTVVLPVYNGEKYLPAAIESILAQTFTDFAFLIIDDGSTDGSADVIQSYAQRDPRIRPTVRSNRGLVATLNEGIAEARGKYIARMDADDISMPERFMQQVAFLDANPRCVALGTSFILIDEAGKEVKIWHCFVHDSTVRHALAAEGCIPHPTAMCRKSAVIEAGGYREDYPAAEDYDLWRRLARIGELSNLAELLLYKREVDAAVSDKHAKTQRQSADRIRDEIWHDECLARYKRMSLRTMSQLPGEHQPALEDLQKELAKIALGHGAVKLFAYLYWDRLRFRMSALWHRGRTRVSSGRGRDSVGQTKQG